MENQYKKLFARLSEETPPSGLSARIIGSIEKIERRRTWIRSLIFGGITVGAIGAFIPSLIYTIQSFSTSGFSQYFSLIFSDSGIVLSHWQTFGSSLFEVFPVTEVAILLGTCAVMLWAARSLAKTFPRNMGQHSLQALA